MGQPVSHSMCCSVRDKEMVSGKPPVFNVTAPNPLFTIDEVLVTMQRPQILAFAPLWQVSGGPGLRRRMAMASESSVHVYRMEEPEELVTSNGSGAPLRLWLEHKLDLPAGMSVTAMTFGERGDEGGAKRRLATLILGAGPVEGVGGPPVIKIWRCDSTGNGGSEAMSKVASLGGVTSAPDPNVWKWDQGHIATLTDHTSQVHHLTLSTAFLLSGDDDGWVRLWDKPRQYALVKAERVVGAGGGGLSDMTADRHFLFTVGKQDTVIKVWTVPEFRLALRISTAGAIQNFLAPAAALVGPPAVASAAHAETSPRGSSPSDDEGTVGMAGMSRAGTETSQHTAWMQLQPSQPLSARRRPQQLAQITGLRRPTSRWSGAQPSKNVREGGPPKGLLFVAGQLLQGADPMRAGHSFLMVWCLRQTPTVLSMEMGQDAAIASMSYGPYDNGPLVTADTRGVFWVWEFAPRLTAVQQVETGCFGFQCPSMAVDPANRALYAILGGGDNRLFVWRQTHSPNSRAMGDAG